MHVIKSVRVVENFLLAFAVNSHLLRQIQAGLWFNSKPRRAFHTAIKETPVLTVGILLKLLEMSIY